MNYRDVHNTSKQLERYISRINNSSMNDKQKKRIKEFVKDLKIGKAGKKVKGRRIRNYLQFLIKLHNYFKKDIDKITNKEAEKFYQDLQEDKIKKNNGMPYASATKDEFVKTLKRYLGWAWGNKTTKYRKSISWMKEDYKGSDKKAITLEQGKKITDKEKNVRNKCLFMFLFDSGARIEEALNVRIKDIENGSKKNGDKFFKVHLRGQKTQEANRKIAVPLVTKYLNAWLKEHPTKEENDLLFPIRYDNARKIIRIMSLRVLNFHLKPHELRHSSATYYIQYGGFGAENIGGFYYRYGWKFGSKEALTYIKNYMYAGDIGQEKVVKAIESGKVEELEEALKKQNKAIKLSAQSTRLMFEMIKNPSLDKIQDHERLTKEIENLV